MAVELIFFGKPQSFEVFSFNRENKFIEYNSEKRRVIDPHFFLENKDEGTIIRYRRDLINKKNYLLMYTYAQVFSGVRSGIVIGVGFSSKNEIEFSKENLYYLTTLLSSFKNNATKEHKFTEVFLSNHAIDTFKKNSNLIDFIKTKSNSNNKIDKRTQLFYLPSLEEQFNTLEKVNSNDIYITNNLSIFKNSLNQANLNQLNKKIYTVKSNSIVSYIEPQPDPVNPHKEKEVPAKTNAEKEIKTLRAINGHLEKELSDERGKNTYLERSLSKFKKLAMLAGSMAVFFMVLSVAFFFKDSWGNSKDNTKTDSENTIAGAQVAGEESDSIKTKVDSNTPLDYTNKLAVLQAKFDDLHSELTKDNLEKRIEILKEIKSLQENLGLDTDETFNLIKGLNKQLEDLNESTSNKDDSNSYQDDIIFNNAKIENTVKGYNHYLKKFPKGEHKKEAKLKIKELHEKKGSDISSDTVNIINVDENGDGDGDSEGKPYEGLETQTDDDSNGDSEGKPYEGLETQTDDDSNGNNGNN
ncbi:hypothetical protein GO491_07185 [Flavobacteriaceae bacterium Ap0902]|nr:hypothetical protein [Flavobacteriaceae bacterium Ap0902]